MPAEAAAKDDRAAAVTPALRPMALWRVRGRWPGGRLFVPQCFSLNLSFLRESCHSLLSPFIGRGSRQRRSTVRVPTSPNRRSYSLLDGSAFIATCLISVGVAA